MTAVKTAITLVAALTLTVMVNSAHALIIGQVGSAVGSPNASEDFELNLGNLVDTTTWIGSSITALDVGGSADWFDFTGGGGSDVGCISGCIYQNGGTLGLVHILLNSGNDIDAIQLDLGTGFDPSFQYVWVQAYRDGSSTGFEFDFDISSPSTISLLSSGTLFDEIRVGVYGDATTRDLHSTSGQSAASIDNILIEFTDPAPAPVPGTILLLSLSLVGLGWSRRESVRSGAAR